MAIPKVHKKIYVILEFIQRKLQTNYLVDVNSFEEEHHKDYPNANFLVEPSGRGRQDQEAFSIHVHRRVGRMKDFDLFSSVLHELIHVIYWPVVDCHSDALKSVHSKAMKSHLSEDMYDSREQGTYKLERAIAPVLYHEFLLDIAAKASNLPSEPVVVQKEIQNGNEEGRGKEGSKGYAGKGPEEAVS